MRLAAAFSSLARRRTLACVGVLLLTLGMRLALLHWMPEPNPIIHDEFSYLLAADTYAHGRLASPPHRFWQHFETFQELQQPTYASKYPPLQGLALALGEKLGGDAWAGVVLTSALMSAAVCWMLQGWISAEWALGGALLFAFRIGVLSYWINSFEGGAIAAIGGALVFGALARVTLRGAYVHAWTWGLGVAVLIHSRPYDAAVTGLVSAIALAWLLRKSGASMTSAFARVAIPALCVMAVALAGAAYVDLAVTGHATTLPYQAHDREYVAASPFLFTALPPEPVYRHAMMREFYTGAAVQIWKDARSEPLVQLLGRASVVGTFLFGAWPAAVLLLLWPYALKTTEERAGAVFSAAGLASIAPLVGVYPHYAAAFAPVFLLRFLQGLSRLSSWRPALNYKWLGQAAAGAVIVWFVLSGRDSFSATLADRSAHFGAARASVQRKLAALPGPQLVMVRYGAGHNPQNEWVFNAADIDASKVVWAREMTPQQDKPFLEYFHDRQVWLLQPDKNGPDQEPPALTLYREANAITEARK